MDRTGKAGLFSLKGKSVLVTGAAGGMAKGFLEILSDAGADLILVDRNLGAVKEMSKGFKKSLFFDCDVSKKNEILRMISAIEKKGVKIAVLVNCAGVLGKDHPLFDVEESDWDKVFAVNLKGSWMVSTEVARHMVKNRVEGAIINISSACADHAQMRRVDYGTSKAGIEHLTRNMALELLKYRIRVNCLAPGWMATEMVREILEGPEGKKWRQAIPMGRAADPKELAGPLLLLASDASSYMTGSVLRVDGGYSCHELK